MSAKSWCLCEKPTTYTNNYVSPNFESFKKTDHDSGASLQERRKLNSHPYTIAANDTLQRLDYKTRIPFNALWESNDAICFRINPLQRKQYLGDENVEEVIKSRPRVYMTPSISIDDIKDQEIRKLVTNFTYSTMTNRANKDVWNDFKPTKLCSFEERLKNEDHLVVGGIPNMRKTQARLISDQEREIKKLVEQNKLSPIYERFPLSYGGFRSHIALGAKLEKEELPVVHPNLTVSQAVYGKRMTRN